MEDDEKPDSPETEIDAMKTFLSEISADLRELDTRSWETEQAAIRAAEAAMWLDRELERRGR